MSQPDHRARAAELVRHLMVELVSSTPADSPSYEAVSHHLRAALDTLGSTVVSPADPVGRSLAEHLARSFDDAGPVRGALNPLAPPVHSIVGDGVASATVTFGVAYEGFAGCVHGGYVAVVFDEVLGLAMAANGSPAMTAYLNVNYRSPTPLYEGLLFTGALVRTEGRKLFTTGEVHTLDGRLCAEAEALFIAMPADSFNRPAAAANGLPRTP